jgi:hypothetical protein
MEDFKEMGWVGVNWVYLTQKQALVNTITKRTIL